MRKLKFVLAGTAAIGCSSINLQITTAPCINPQMVNGQCRSPEQDSRVLELRAYPLKRCLSGSEVAWQDLQGNDPQKPLEALLAAPQDRAWPQHLLLEPLRRYDLPLQLPTGTRCLLLVARGRREGQQSLAQARITLLLERLTLYVHEFDICVGESCAPDERGGQS